MVKYFGRCDRDGESKIGRASVLEVGIRLG
jgi:hypothetical protein